MKFFVRLFLILSLLIPSTPINSFAQKLPEDCVICGYACCCPEMCKLLIEKMKKEKAASHCSPKRNQSQSKIESCDQPNSICRLQSSSPAGILKLKNEGTLPNLQLTILGDANRSGGISRENIFEASLNLAFSVPLEILIPPPRYFPA